MEETIFDKIISGEIPANIVFESEDVLAFEDIAPHAPVHVLVIPKTKISRLEHAKKLSAEDLGKFMHGVSEVAEKLALNEEGYRVVINNGKNGQQTVEYLHAHIFGGKKLAWPHC